MSKDKFFESKEGLFDTCSGEDRLIFSEGNDQHSDSCGEERGQRRGKAIFYLGCPPEADSLLDHFGISADIIHAVRYAIQAQLDEIRIANVPLGLNILRHRTFPAACFYQMYGSSSWDVARAESEIIGHRYRILIQAIQEWLWEKGGAQGSKKPVQLMSDHFSEHEVKGIFSRLYSLTQGDEFSAQFNIYDREDDQPFEVRDDTFASRIWEMLPEGLRTSDPILKEQGRAAFSELDEKEKYHAINLMAYVLFQFAAVLKEGGEKHGFSKGEKRIDELTSYCLKFADALGLDAVSRAIKFVYPDLGEASEFKGIGVPYRSIRFGTRANFPVLALGGYGKIRDLEGHLRQVMQDYFPIQELFLRKIKKDPTLETKPVSELRETEAVDYLFNMLHGHNDGQYWESAMDAGGIEVRFQPEWLQALPLNEVMEDFDLIFNYLKDPEGKTGIFPEKIAHFWKGRKKPIWPRVNGKKERFDLALKSLARVISATFETIKEYEAVQGYMVKKIHELGAKIPPDPKTLLKRNAWGMKGLLIGFEQGLFGPQSLELHDQLGIAVLNAFEAFSNHPHAEDLMIYLIYHLEQILGKNNFSEYISQEGVRVSQPIKEDIFRLEVHKVIREMVAALQTDSEIAECLSQSGILGAVAGDYPISEIPQHNHTGIQLEEMPDQSVRFAKIAWLRDRIERKKIQIRNYVEMDGLEEGVIVDQENLFRLLGEAHRITGHRDVSLDYLLRSLRKVLTSFEDRKPAIFAQVLDFCERMERILAEGS